MLVKLFNENPNHREILKIVEVLRKGEAGSSRTTYSILYEEEVDKHLAKKITGLELHDLEQMTSGDSKKEESEEKPSKKKQRRDELIDPRVASGLIPRLKALPPKATDDFLAKFKVEYVRDIPAKKEEAVLMFVDILEEKYGNQRNKKEKDPFAMTPES